MHGNCNPLLFIKYTERIPILYSSYFLIHEYLLIILWWFWFLVPRSCARININMTVKCTVIKEGAATSMMSLSCWNGLGSPELSQSTTMLTVFNCRSFQLHGILPCLKVQLGGKTIAIEVEVVDAPLDYNILLGRNWMYSMQVVASSLFWVVCFPFNGKIIMIDQTLFYNPSVNASLGTSIPIIDHS